MIPINFDILYKRIRRILRKTLWFKKSFCILAFVHITPLLNAEEVLVLTSTNSKFTCS